MRGKKDVHVIYGIDWFCADEWFWQPIWRKDRRILICQQANAGGSFLLVERDVIIMLLILLNDWWYEMGVEVSKEEVLWDNQSTVLIDWCISRSFLYAF
jgi:hypothetical protein